MTFDLIEKDDIMMGQPFDVSIQCNNTASVDRSLKVTLTASIVFYTGVFVKVVKCETQIVHCGPKSSKFCFPGFRISDRLLCTAKVTLC